MSEKDDNKPKSCPSCRKRKPIFEVYGDAMISVPKTLGSLAEKNAKNMSEDEKQHRHHENNKYRETAPSWESTQDGIKRVNIPQEARRQ